MQWLISSSGCGRDVIKGSGVQPKAWRSLSMLPVHIFQPVKREIIQQPKMTLRGHRDTGILKETATPSDTG
jgi:hypothetical protein